MAKYKVTVVGLLLRNNTMAKGNDIVDEESLTKPAETLVSENRIVKATADEIKEWKELQTPEGKKAAADKAAADKAAADKAAADKAAADKAAADKAAADKAAADKAAADKAAADKAAADKAGQDPKSTTQAGAAKE